LILFLTLFYRVNVCLIQQWKAICGRKKARVAYNMDYFIQGVRKEYLPPLEIGNGVSDPLNKVVR
jgi:hypothetical protein